MITNLEDFKAYQKAMVLGENVWRQVGDWNILAKDTIGKQLIRSCDSIAANLSEGLGRYHYKETRNFSFYARGSLFETRTWLTKALNRNLITKDQYDNFESELDHIGKMINGYIKSIGQVNEPMEPYGDNLMPNS